MVVTFCLPASRRKQHLYLERCPICQACTLFCTTLTCAKEGTNEVTLDVSKAKTKVHKYYCNEFEAPPCKVSPKKVADLGI